MENELPRLRLNSESLPIRTFSRHSTKTLPRTDFDFGVLPRYQDFRSLGRYLRKCMSDQAGTGVSGGEGFLPPALLSKLLPKEIIEQELRKNGCNFDPVMMTQKVLGPLADDDDEFGGEKKSYLYIIALLGLLDKVCEIENFVEDNDGGIWDGDLPLQLHNGRDGSRELRRRQNSRLIRCFESWTDGHHQLFSDYQWRLLIPTFALNADNTIQELDLPDEIILPWCDEQLQRDNVPMSGAFGSVKKVKIHPLCHEFHERLKAVCVSIPLLTVRYKGRILTDTALLDQINVSGGVFAVKTLKHADVTKFQHEVDMLKKFNGLVHDHLVTLLGTYRHKQQFSMIFPSAECDVEEYWEKRNHTPDLYDSDFVRWVSSQCRGIMDAVNVIHNPPHLLKDKVFGRHGDIKSENILWFKSPENAGKGIWVISDLGLSAFNREVSRSMVPNQSITWTPAYRPPECDIDGGTISRAFDIWTLGCFYLEMICWLLGGWELNDKFRTDRTTIYVHGTNSDIFFDLQLNPDDETNETFIALVKPQVAEVRSFPPSKGFKQP
jgi:Protein kinase domain